MMLNAPALHTTPSSTTDVSTDAEGHAAGQECVTATTGAYTTAVTANATAVTPAPGRSGIHLAMIAGPSAYPTTTTRTLPTAPMSEPATVKPTSAATPPMPSAMPSQFSGASRSGRPSRNAMPTPASGTAATSRPVVELGSRSSAEPSRNWGTPSATTVNASIGRQRRSTGMMSPLAAANGSSTAAAIAVLASTSMAGSSCSTATLISR